MSDNPNVAVLLRELLKFMRARSMGPSPYYKPSGMTWEQVSQAADMLAQTINALEAQASAPGMPGIDDDTAAYVDPDKRSIHIDWDADPANQFSLIVKRDGSVAFAAYHHGQMAVGNAMGSEFKQAMRLWASAPGGVGNAVTPKHGADAGDGMRYVLCKVGFGGRYADWLLIPHADGQYVTAAKLQPMSIGILNAALAARTDKGEADGR